MFHFYIAQTFDCLRQLTVAYLGSSRITKMEVENTWRIVTDRLKLSNIIFPARIVRGVTAKRKKRKIRARLHSQHAKSRNRCLFV
jgi:hypothetical protein